MEVPKRKVTAKVSPQNINGHGTSSSSSLSILPSPQVIVRAQISSTARARTSPNIPDSGNANGSANSNINGALRPHAGATARRSPSPAKMRPGSPSKLQSHLRPSTSRAPLVKSPTIVPHPDRTRHGSMSSVLSLTPGGSSSSPASAPATPLPHRDDNNAANGNTSLSLHLDSGSGSFRIKSKVSGLAKQAPPSLSTILSPPSPLSSPSIPLFPHANRPPRARATTIASRRPSVSFSVAQSHSSHSVTPVFPHEHVPLPTSPPASTLSHSSHSSVSVSASSAHSCSTSTGLSHPPSSASHARSESSPVTTSSTQMTGAPSSSHDEQPTSPPPRRTLIARVRSGTRISGGNGKGQGRTSGSSVSGEQDLASSNSVRTVELDHRNTDESERSDDETRKRTPQSIVEDNPEDDMRAEAKSNRKIADLEITTHSLLTINAALEASKLRQAREIRELRRKLRETRLAMPPGRFRLLSEQERGEGGNEDAKDEESDENEEDTDENDCDESFKRAKMLLEDLLVLGRNALTTPSPSSLLGAHQAISSPSSTSGDKLGLGIDTRLVTGMRREQGEVLGWDMGSSLGTDSSSNVGKDSGSRQWKHGVAIRSKVLSPEEAKLWVGEDEIREGGENNEVEHKVEHEHEVDGAGVPTADEDTTDSYGDIEPDNPDALP